MFVRQTSGPSLSTSKFLNCLQRVCLDEVLLIGDWILLIGDWILLIGDWIFRGIGSGRGLLIGDWIY